MIGLNESSLQIHKMHLSFVILTLFSPYLHLPFDIVSIVYICRGFLPLPCTPYCLLLECHFVINIPICGNKLYTPCKADCLHACVSLVLNLDTDICFHQVNKFLQMPTWQKGVPKKHLLFYTAFCLLPIFTLVSMQTATKSQQILILSLFLSWL